MKTVVWQSRSKAVFDALLSKSIAEDASGGNTYDFMAASALNKIFLLHTDLQSVFQPDDSLAGYWWRNARHRPQADLIVREPYPVVFGSSKIKCRKVAVVHHVDESEVTRSLKHKWFFNQLRKKLRSYDLVVTVSEFWKNQLLNDGCKNVKVIYNAFDISQYTASDQEKSAFRNVFGFDANRPLIYIGNAHRQKGVYEVYDALKNAGFQLLMTGKKNSAPGLPVKYLNLSRKDFITMLASCDVVISFSQMPEGWNRIAHEALLCKTPVIGSGTGGMKELLAQSGQKIVTEKSVLLQAVNDVLKDRSALAETGSKFAGRFDLSYFEREWLDAITNLLE